MQKLKFDRRLTEHQENSDDVIEWDVLKAAALVALDAPKRVKLSSYPQPLVS